jgi:hypothetical protein
MSLQIRRGTAAQLANITPVVGELIYTTDTQAVFVGDGSTAGGIPVAVGGSGNVSGTNLLTAGIASATGNVYGNNIFATGFVSATGNVTGNYVLGNGALLTGIVTSATAITNGTSEVNIGASNGNANISINGTSNVVVVSNTRVAVTGAITATGNITGSYIFGNGSQLTDVVAATVGTLPSLSVTGNTISGNINVLGSQTTVGNVVGGNILTGGTISAVGNITVNAGGFFIGNGSQLTGIVSTYSNANVAAYLPTHTGNVAGGNILVTGIISAGGNITGANVSATNLSGTILTASQTNITSLGTLSALTVTGNITGGNLRTAGLITATGNIDGGNINSAGSVTATGNIQGGNLRTAGLITATGNVEGGNINSAGTISAAGNITGGNISTAGAFGAASLSASGNITGGNIRTAGLITATGNIDGANLTTGGRVLATGNVTGSNLTTGGIVTAIGNVIGANFLTLGSLSAAGNIIGSNFATSANISAGNIQTTGIGNVGQLTVSNDAIIGGNLTVNGNISYVNVETFNVEDPIIGLGRGANNAPLASDDGKDRGEQLWYYSGSEKSAFIGYDNSAGKLLGATSVTIANELVSIVEYGNVVFGNVEAQGTISAVGNITGGNINTSGILSITGNVTGGNLVTAGVVTATGNIQGGNLVTAGLISATGAITGAAITGTSLTVSTGNVTCGNIVNSNANGVGNIGSASTYFNTLFATATSAQYADLAEKYTSDADYAPGTVVMFGGDAEVTRCDTDSCSAVVGVVSSNPAYLMNSGLTGEHVAAVALMGRVPCAVQGPVTRGALMVSAGNGRARAETNPAPGTIIGKAVESFNGSVGTIEILVGRV